MTKTNFFTELNDVLQGTPCILTITPRNGKLVVSFLPREINDAKSTLKPLNMTGTTDEFDEGFLDSIDVAVKVAAEKGLIDNKAIQGWAENQASPKATKKENKAESKEASEKEEKATEGEPTPEKHDMVLKLKKQKKSIAFIVEKTGLDEELVKEIIANNPLKKEEPSSPKGELKQLSIPEAEEGPKKVQHTPEDLERFKTILTNQLHDAEDTELLATRKKERTTDEGQIAELTGDINRAKSTIANCKVQLEAIEAGTYGTRKDQTELVPADEIIKTLTSKSN